MKFPCLHFTSSDQEENKPFLSLPLPHSHIYTICYENGPSVMRSCNLQLAKLKRTWIWNQTWVLVFAPLLTSGWPWISYNSELYFYHLWNEDNTWPAIINHFLILFVVKKLEKLNVTILTPLIYFPTQVDPPLEQSVAKSNKCSNVFQPCTYSQILLAITPLSQNFLSDQIS